MTDKPKLDLRIDLAGARRWTGIVWHHSATPDSPTLDWEGIRRYHTSYRVDFQVVTADEYQRRLAAKSGKSFQTPWRDIGYHGGTESVGDQVVFHWGRPLGQVGAHAGVHGASNRFNEEYLGLCAVGDFDKAPPRPEHWDFNLRLTRALMRAFHIPAGHVIGHREVFDKVGVPRQRSCPGARWDMTLFKSEL